MKFPSALTLLFASALSFSQAEPVQVIFDTDMCGDVDDALALAMLHTLADRGECELLAVTASQDNPQIAPFIDAVNTFYGRPNIPVGIVENGEERGSKYLKLVDEMKDGAPRYPHDLKVAEKAVPLLRKTLAAAEDNSVVIVQVGFATNLAQLLDSSADDISPLSGKDLVAKKVSFLSLMAGSFQTIRDSNHFLEFNVYNDIPGMQKIANEWPTPRIWSGFEIGIAAPYPYQSILRDFEWEPKHIIKEAYLLYCAPDHDRPTWDLTSVLYAVRPDWGYFDLSLPGQVWIEDDSFSKFMTPAEMERDTRRLKNGWKKSAESERDRFLKMSPLQIERVREALIHLVSHPPVK